MEPSIPPRSSPQPRPIGAVALATILLVGAFAALVPGAAEAAAPYRPAELRDSSVQDATLRLSLKYAHAVPGLDAKTLRWYLYAIEHRESTFNARHCNYGDGAGSWNAPREGHWPTSDHLPHGCGLMQPTGWWHAGMPYPDGKATTPHVLYKGIYGLITPPKPVSRLDNPFDAGQNIERFITEHLLPDYLGIKKKYSWFSTEETLRAVAFHWNKGDYVQYDAKNCSYLCLYDKYVSIYKPAVLNDKAWPGGAPTASFTTSSGVNRWWVEVAVKPSSGDVTATSAWIDGRLVPLKATSWGTWATSTYVPSGASVTYVATVNGAHVYSGAVRWR